MLLIEICLIYLPATGITKKELEMEIECTMFTRNLLSSQLSLSSSIRLQLAKCSPCYLKPNCPRPDFSDQVWGLLRNSPIWNSEWAGNWHLNSPGQLEDLKSSVVQLRSLHCPTQPHAGEHYCRLVPRPWAGSYTSSALKVPGPMFSCMWNATTLSKYMYFRDRQWWLKTVVFILPTPPTWDNSSFSHVYLILLWLN